MGCCLWGRTELDTTEATQQQQKTHNNIIVFIFKFLGPLGEDFYAEDFYLLEKITFTKFVANIEDIVKNTEINSKK